MRIRVLSDLHREFGHVPLPEVAADVVVLAGDIDRSTRGVSWACSAFPDVPVLYIAGNHEHYDERIGRLHEKLREVAAGSNVHVLENEIFELNGYRFFGATLWTDFALLGARQAAMIAAETKETGMTDFRKIRRLDAGKFRPKHAALLHAESRLKLAQFLAAGDRSRSVVITYHAPSPQSIPVDKASDLLSAAYASNLEDQIAAAGPALWVHGHIHHARAYCLEGTRIVNNALGYPGTNEVEGRGFRGDLVIEL